MFEAAVAVGKAAVGGGNVAQAAFVAVVNLHALQQMLEFDAIGADVLYGGGTGTTGDEGEVFRAVPAFACAPGGHRVPGFARLYLQEDAVRVFADDALAAVLRTEDARLDFFAADGVAAAAEDAVAGRGGAPFFRALYQDEFAREGRAGKGVARGEVGVVFGLHGQVGFCCLRLVLYVHHAKALPPCM